MDSKPPATIARASPARIAWLASITALRPDPHTLFTVTAGTVAGTPPRIAACRAGAWPRPAETTLPRITSSTASGSIPERSTAARTTTAPSSVAESGLSAPRYRPMGVRAPPSSRTGVLALSVIDARSAPSCGLESARSRLERGFERTAV